MMYRYIFKIQVFKNIFNDVCIAMYYSVLFSRYLCTSLTFHDSFSKFLGQCVHEGVSWRRPLLCTCSPYILWSSLRGKKGKFWKFEKSFGSEHVSPLFFFAFGAAAVANCYRATLCLAEQKNIFLHFVQKYQDITTHSFHFWHFFPVEDLSFHVAIK